MVSAYDELPRTPANFVALSPLRYLERAAYIYPHQNAIIHGARQITWRETYLRAAVSLLHQLQQLALVKKRYRFGAASECSCHARSTLCCANGGCSAEYPKHSFRC